MKLSSLKPDPEASKRARTVAFDELAQAELNVAGPWRKIDNENIQLFASREISA